MSQADQETRKPTLMRSFDDDEDLNEYVMLHASYYTVVQITPGGFVRGGDNYDRHEVASLEEARSRAKELYDADPNKRGILIYAVADFAGASGFSRPVDQYPPSKTFESKSRKAAREKKEKARAREAARAAKKAKTE